MLVEDAPATVVRDLGLTLGFSTLLMIGFSLAILARYDLTRARCEELRQGLEGAREQRLAQRRTPFR